MSFLSLRQPLSRKSSFSEILTTVITAENHLTSKQQQWRIPLKEFVDSGKTFFDISVNNGQIDMGLKADIP